MFLRSGQDEDDMCRWLLQRLQESVEGSSRQHVNLVDDEHLILADLRWYTCLLHQRLDVLNGVVGGSIKFKDVKWTLFVKCLTALTLSAGFTISCGCQAVDGFSEDTSTGGLSNATWTAEEVGMSQFPTFYGILQCRRQCLLTYNRIEGCGSVFSRWNDVFFHINHWICVQRYKNIFISYFIFIIFFVTLTTSKILPLGKIQINLVFLSLICIFASEIELCNEEGKEYLAPSLSR